MGLHASPSPAPYKSERLIMPLTPAQPRAGFTTPPRRTTPLPARQALALATMVPTPFEQAGLATPVATPRRVARPENSTSVPRQAANGSPLSPAPRKSLRQATAYHRERNSYVSPPPLPRQGDGSRLMMALRKHSLQCVETVLQEDRNAAKVPCMLTFEPPLVSAVQLSCDADIIAALLGAGADVKAADMRGQTPLMVLAQLSCWEEAPANVFTFDFGGGVQSFAEHRLKQEQDHALEAALAFAKFGADPTAPDDNGRIPLDVARTRSSARLLEFWQRCLAKEAAVFIDMAVARAKLRAIPREVLHSIAVFL